MIFVTADLHLNHCNIIKYCNRPFKTVEEMNKTLINNWNSKVTKEDVVFHLGDFCFGPYKEFERKLNGKIVYITKSCVASRGKFIQSYLDGLRRNIER
jgi:calcineurin-like phosphoesterase family protein